MVTAPAPPAHVQVSAAAQHRASARLLESWALLLLWPSLLYPTEVFSVSKRTSGDRLATEVVIGSVGV